MNRTWSADEKSMKPLKQTILLIEDDAEYVALLTGALVSCGHTFEVRAAESLAAGLASLERFSPQIILVDLNLPDASGYETFLRVREHALGIPVIVLTALDDDDTAVQAVQDGAEDYLVKSDVQPARIARCLKMALSRQTGRAAGDPRHLSEPGVVLSCIGSKGGIGTSTTVMNLAALLAQSGLDTLLIEFRWGCPGSLNLYLESEPGDPLMALLQPAWPIPPAQLRHCLVDCLPGLRLLCPARSGTTWPVLDAVQVQAIVAAARRVSPCVVLDLPARLDEGVAEALRLSDCVTVLVDREVSSLHSAAAFLDQIAPAASNAREFYLAAIDRTGLQQPLPLSDLKTRLKMHPLVSIPHVPDGIAQSHATRTPFVSLYPDDQFSNVMVELAERMLITAGGRPLPDKIGKWLGQSAYTIPEATYG